MANLHSGVPGRTVTNHVAMVLPTDDDHVRTQPRCMVEETVVERPWSGMNVTHNLAFVSLTLFGM
jgi:hypothetical protein